MVSRHFYSPKQLTRRIDCCTQLEILGSHFVGGPERWMIDCSVGQPVFGSVADAVNTSRLRPYTISTPTPRIIEKLKGGEGLI